MRVCIHFKVLISPEAARKESSALLTECMQVHVARKYTTHCAALLYSLCAVCSIPKNETLRPFWKRISKRAALFIGHFKLKLRYWQLDTQHNLPW